MTNAMKRNPTGGSGPRMLLYTLGILVAIMAAILVKTTAVDNSGLSRTANLSSFSPLTVAPVANQSDNTGRPIAPIALTATDAQTSPFPVITWAANGLPPGISISRSSGLVTGTPTLAGTYAVTISAKDNSHPPTFGSTSFTWSIGNMAPIISQVVPVISEGVGGIRVIITGQNFIGAPSVKFGLVEASSITVNRHGTRIVTFAPPELAGTVHILVTAMGGTNAPVPADQFTYLAPTVNLLATPSGSVSGGTRVRISGSGLAGATSVTFGGVPTSSFTVRRHGTMMTAVAPPGSPRTVTIVIVTPGGTTSTSGHNNYTYVVPPPPPPKKQKQK